MDFGALIFESQLEAKALQYLSAVNENPNSDQTKLLVRELIALILSQDLTVLKISSTGNAGIAFKSMLENRLIENQQLQLVLTLLSYYLLTNHITNPSFDKHPLLHIARAQLMYGAIDLFKQIYKQVDPPGDNPYFSHNLSADYAVSMTLLNDFFPHRDYNEECKQSYTRMHNKLSEQTSLADYRETTPWMTRTHDKLSARIKEMLNSLIPALRKA
jgi:hypothetical protein